MTDEFIKAVESALTEHKIEWQSWRGQRPEGDAFGLKFDPTAEALASIQASVTKLLEQLKKDMDDVCWEHSPDNDYPMIHRGRLSDIDQLIKDLSKGREK